MCTQITESTTIAEKEKQKVAVIVDSVTKKAAEIAAVKVRPLTHIHSYAGHTKLATCMSGTRR